MFNNKRFGSIQGTLLALVCCFFTQAGNVFAESENPNFPLNLFQNPPASNRSIQAKARILPWLIRQRVAYLDIHALRPGELSSRAVLPSAKHITFNLFDDVTLTAEKVRLIPNRTGGYVWVGRIPSTVGGDVFLDVQKDRVFGNIYYNGRQYQIRNIQGHLHQIDELDPAFIPGEWAPREITSPSAQVLADPPPAQADTIMYLDILVVYTADAFNAFGGASAMQSELDVALAEANGALVNSQLNARMSVVASRQVTYTESENNTLAQALNDFKEDLTLSGEISILRDQFGADLVVLVVEGDMSRCSIANQMTVADASFSTDAFSVVERSCVSMDLTLAHAIGHNLGARHDWASDSTDGEPFTYNHGYIGPLSRFRTVMADAESCNSCPLALHWSNPDINFGSDPTGIPEGEDFPADNSRVLRETIPLAENFRAAISPHPCFPSSTVQPAPSDPTSQKVISPYWQSGTGVYSFLAINHPSAEGMSSRIGVVVSALLADGTGLYGDALEFTITPNESRQVFINPVNHPFINSDTFPAAKFIQGSEGACAGQLRVEALAESPNTVLADGAYPDVTGLTLWGAVVLEASSTGFAMEFIGDLQDSRALKNSQFSGLN